MDKALPSLKIGEVEIFWLDGGQIRLDGGPMFGPVPKVLWSNRVEVGEDNCIAIDNAALLLLTPSAKIVIDSGIGNKLTAKQDEHFQVQKPWRLPESLKQLGLNVEDIDVVIPTHADFDHAGGIVSYDRNEKSFLTFPRARHILQKKEWEVIKNPDRRSASSYWPENFSGLIEGENLEIIDGDFQLTPEVKIFLTGGHTIGHQAIEIVSKGETAVHLGDLLPSKNHLHPLWVIAYDDYPMEVIALKERLLPEYAKRKAWILLYHDTEILAGRATLTDGPEGVGFNETLKREVTEKCL
ncbi:MAG: MBL fold metallo-hydrolase [Deltaproteobacteria bacterium]|nr:MBL fold metallo-hydrolase [Candidatus Tharpella sp.]